MKQIASIFKNHSKESLKRLETCKQCNKNKLGMCLLCGCIVNNKVKIHNEKCPKGKW